MADGTAAPSALDGFLADVERRALRMAEYATGNRDDALELVQEAMLRLVERYAGRDPADWPRLFHRILHNAINDWYRRRSVRRRWLVRARPADDPEADPVPEAPDPADPDPAREVARDAAMEALRQGLRALPLRQQQAFLLRVWEGLDVAETAYAMGCSEGSVKTHLSRAMGRLREQLGNHWP